jgi:hypothetical protein
VYAATTAINTIGTIKSAKAEVKAVEATAAEQVKAAMGGAADFQVQTLAAQQQQALATERDALATRAEEEARRQARLITNVDVTTGPSLADAREARLRRRRFFDQETP